MKKSLLWIAGLVSLMFSMTPFTANAQRGDKTLGVMGGFATYNDGGFMKAYFQYSVLDHIRIAPDIGYVFRNDGASAFLLDVDVQFPFRIARGFGIYPLVGFTFNNWSYEHHDNESRAGGNIGAGFDINLTSYLKLTLEGKYSFMNDTGGAFFGMGIGYVF